MVIRDAVKTVTSQFLAPILNAVVSSRSVLYSQPSQWGICIRGCQTSALFEKEMQDSLRAVGIEVGIGSSSRYRGRLILN